MKTFIFAIALLAIGGTGAHAWEDCRSKAVDVQLTITPLDQLATPNTQTDVVDPCIRDNTLVELRPVSPLSSSFRWWQEFPNVEPRVAVIRHSALILNCSAAPDLCPTWRFLVTFRNVEID